MAMNDEARAGFPHDSPSNTDSPDARKAQKHCAEPTLLEESRLPPDRGHEAEETAKTVDRPYDRFEVVREARVYETHGTREQTPNQPVICRLPFPMKTNPLLLIGPLLIAGCAAQRVEHPLARELRRPGVQPEIFRIGDKDAQMRRAVREARRTVGVFIAAIKSPAKGQHDFEVKKPFIKDGEVEHLWLSGVEFSGNRFHGRVDNRPAMIKGLKYGDRVSVNPGEISDWAFVDNGKLVGGY
ncbi:MAG: DUF2314 domain-containing protein, partial [Chthoniobacteraceae bacterium]